MFAPEGGAQVNGGILVRVSRFLTPDQAKEYQATLGGRTRCTRLRTKPPSACVFPVIAVLDLRSTGDADSFDPWSDSVR